MNSANCKKKRIIKFVSAVTAAVVLFSLSFGLIGCSIIDFFGNGLRIISFTVTSLNLKTGDKYDLSSVIECRYNTYSVSSSDSAVVSVSGTVVTAKSAGNAELTASSGVAAATLTVRVTESEPDSFSIVVEGRTVQTAGDTGEVRFIPVAGGNNEGDVVYWYVNGKTQAVTATYESFGFTPSEIGTYEVTAGCGKLSDTAVVRVCPPVEANVTHKGEFTQSSPFSAVEFTVDTSGTGDPYFEWEEGGEKLYEGESSKFSYMPTPGRHTLILYVNGEKKYSADFACTGATTPKAPTVRFDNVYPHVYIEYDVPGEVAVEITPPDGKANVYKSIDGKSAARFTDGCFDAEGIIEVCSSSTMLRSYKIRVKSLGDGALYTESEYSSAYSFMQLPNAAEKYLKTKLAGGDLYATSESEFVEIAEYYINFRTKRASARVSYECYMGFDPGMSAEQLWSAAFPIAATSGSYTNIRVNDRNRVFSASFNVSTVNDPSRGTSPSSGESDCASQLHAILPHINYDESKYRNANDFFPIDGREASTAVTYTDELYIAAQNGARPVPAEGSTAKVVYELARETVGKICSEDMTDRQKAHAIYDWIMWQVTYDVPSTQANNGESYSAYYLEGVFGDGKTEMGGKTYYPYAVCDGMSKAYSLMCNIEGIPCVRVVGKAGDSLSSAGGHAWNKVFLDGAWYAVDCTWGDSQSYISFDGKRTLYELGLHDHLFVTDAQIVDHYEPYRTGETSIVYAPKTATLYDNVYDGMMYNGKSINCHVRRDENTIERVREIASAFAASYVKRDEITVPGGTRDGKYEIGYQGLDIYVDDMSGVSDRTIDVIVRAAILEKHPTAQVKTVLSDNIILILVR